MNRTVRLGIGCSVVLLAIDALAGLGGSVLAKEGVKSSAEFSIHKPVSGPGVSRTVASGSVLVTATARKRVVVRALKGWEVWNVGDEGEVLDTGHVAWSGENKSVRIEWEKADAEEIGVSVAMASCRGDPTGKRHDAFRLSDWMIATKEPVALPFLGRRKHRLRFWGRWRVEGAGSQRRGGQRKVVVVARASSCAPGWFQGGGDV